MLPGDAALVPLCTGTRLRGDCSSKETPGDAKCCTKPAMPEFADSRSPVCCSPGGGGGGAGIAPGLSPAPACGAQGALSPSPSQGILSPSWCLLHFLHLML